MPERRPTDLVALTAGLLCLVVAVLTLLSTTGAADVDGLVVLAAVWLVVGAVGLGATARRLLGRRSA